MNTSSNKPSLTVEGYLSQYREEMPQWLCDYSNGAEVTFADVMSSRVGYYPGSGLDGSLLMIGNRSHALHSYLYVDYGISKKDVLNELSYPNSIRGYHSIGHIEWKATDILPNGSYPMDIDKRPRHSNPNLFVLSDEVPYCITMIMERDAAYDDSWGAARFAFTFLFADGIASYYQLFCKEYKKAPWLFLLQDHGFGGNYDCFGRGGILDAIILKHEVCPKFVLCGNNTRIWAGYSSLEEVAPLCGGMHHHARSLCINIIEQDMGAKSD